MPLLRIQFIWGSYFNNHYYSFNRNSNNIYTVIICLIVLSSFRQTSKPLEDKTNFSTTYFILYIIIHLSQYLNKCTFPKLKTNRLKFKISNDLDINKTHRQFKKAFIHNLYYLPSHISYSSK